jgi:hypothetical protein|tara:strand:- start:2903 stop:3103 length:201 start_codon:yes stop_codon:yes gene_type:complete
MKTYVATIQVAIMAEDEAEVADVLSDGLREIVLDWSYLKLGGQWMYATDTNLNIDPRRYAEGSVFD